MYTYGTTRLPRSLFQFFDLIFRMLKLRFGFLSTSYSFL